MKLKAMGMMVILLTAGSALAGRQTTKTATVKDPEIVDLQGYEKLVAQSHGKPLLVNFWATWCEPCRHEYPMLNELAKQYASQGLKVVGVSMDDDGDLILMRRFLARYKPIFPNYRKNAGEIGSFTQAVLPGWSGSLPVSIFYGKDGQQAGAIMGEGTREKYEAAIQSLLGTGAK